MSGCEKTMGREALLTRPFMALEMFSLLELAIANVARSQDHDRRRRADNISIV